MFFTEIFNAQSDRMKSSIVVLASATHAPGNDTVSSPPRKNKVPGRKIIDPEKCRYFFMRFPGAHEIEKPVGPRVVGIGQCREMPHHGAVRANECEIVEIILFIRAVVVE